MKRARPESLDRPANGNDDANSTEEKKETLHMSLQEITSLCDGVHNEDARKIVLAATTQQETVLDRSGTCAEFLEGAQEKIALLSVVYKKGDAILRSCKQTTAVSNRDTDALILAPRVFLSLTVPVPLAFAVAVEWPGRLCLGLCLMGVSDALDSACRRKMKFGPTGML